MGSLFAALLDRVTLLVFEEVLGQTKDKELQGTLLHDLAIMRERTGNRDEAVKLMERSIERFT